MASSRPFIWRASVRAKMTKSGSLLAFTAALIFNPISSLGMTRLLAKWPQRLGITWSSSKIPLAPRGLEGIDGALDVMQIAVPGVAVGDDRDANARSHAAHRIGHFGHREKIQVRQAKHGGAGAKPAYKHRLKAGLLDHQRGS